MRDKVEVVCAVKLVQKISAKWSEEDCAFLVCFPAHQMIISLNFKKFKTI